MNITVLNKKTSEKTILSKYPDATIIDVTSKGIQPYIQLSPFFPHGDIPVPFSENIVSNSVEGIWQGLKVFENEDIDISKFNITSMKGLKRTVRKLGKPLGHRKGINGKELLTYLNARIQIYLPTYLWVLKNKNKDVLENIKQQLSKTDIIFLDYETNSDVYNFKKPLSHAALIKLYMEDNYPLR